MYERPYRKRLRHTGFDYRAPCCVHVTICTYGKQQMFGTFDAEGMHLNDAGHFADVTIGGFTSDAAGVGIDVHIVMPDHVHAIISLGTNPHVDTTESISDIVHRFKLRVMKAWTRGIRTRGWAPYDTQLWQRSFHDTVIEHERHFESTRDYILANPARWFEQRNQS